MSWIISLILIGIIVWLFMNALNEKQWVDAHSHDEKVAADPGLFGSFTDATGTGAASGTPNAAGTGQKLQNVASAPRAILSVFFRANTGGALETDS